jgi:nicotinamide mononucleotide transporter
MDAVKEWIMTIKGEYNQASWLEVVGVCFGIAEVLFARLNKIGLYPCGLVSISITACLYFDVRLYAEILLQAYYFAMSVYGWILWSGNGSKRLNISPSTNKEKIISIVIVAVSWSLLYMFLKRFTNSDVPIWDSLVSAFAWAGMWLLAKRKLENWIFLNISNLVAVPLLIHKKLLLYSLLTVFLFVVAVFGYFEWKKIINSRKGEIDKNNLTL